MWQVFYLIKEAFFRDAADYFAGKKNLSFFFLQNGNLIFIKLRNHELST